MKKTIFVVLFLVLAVSIAAYGVKAFSLSEVELGSDSQKREQTAAANLRITNNETTPVTVVLSSNIASTYQLSLSQTSVTVAAGQSADVSVTVYVPDNQIVGRKLIGTLTGTANSVAKSSNVYLTAKNELVITKVRAVVDGDSNSLDDREDVDAAPGNDVELEITVKNEYDENVEIQDITVDIQSDNDLDWDDDKDISDLEDGDKDTVTFSFSIPSDIDEDDYDVDITVEGQDENGVRHEDSWTITINVDRESHEITIKSFTLNPSSISCGGRVTAKLNIENTGSNNEDKVALVIRNGDLKIDEYTQRMELDEGDDVDKTYTFTIGEKTVPGEYILQATAYYDADEETDAKVASLIVTACTPTTPTTPTIPTVPTTPTVPTQPPIIAPTGNVVGPSYGTSSFWNSDAYLIMLIAAVVIIILLVLVLLVKFVF